MYLQVALAPVLLLLLLLLQQSAVQQVGDLLPKGGWMAPTQGLGNCSGKAQHGMSRQAHHLLCFVYHC